MRRSAATLRVAVITGGHGFEEAPFQELFRALPGIEATIQSMDAWASASTEARAASDVVVFYSMLMEGPADDGLPPHQGRPLSALGDLLRSGQGIVLLHHAILAYPTWTPWSDLVGIGDRRFGYHFGGPVTTDVADATHPITSGLPPSWTLDDETYTMAEPAGEHVRVLLTTAHQPSMRAIAWTNLVGQTRVFCYQSGHGPGAYRDANFREVLRRGIIAVADGPS